MSVTGVTGVTDAFATPGMIPVGINVCMYILLYDTKTVMYVYAM